MLGFSWGVSSGQALPSILFLASAYSASRWARDLTCGVGLFWFKGDPNDPLLVGRFKMRIWGGGAAGRESSCITMVVLNGDRWELLLDSLEADRQEADHAKISNMTDRKRLLLLRGGGGANNSLDDACMAKRLRNRNPNTFITISVCSCSSAKLHT